MAVPTPAPIVITDHIAWAECVGRGIAKKFGFFRGSADSDDLKAEAVARLVEKATEFIPPRHLQPNTTLRDAFRGWMHREITGWCTRCAVRLTNGGTYNTRRENEHAPIGVIHVGTVGDDADGESSHYGGVFVTDSDVSTLLASLDSPPENLPVSEPPPPLPDPPIIVELDAEISACNGIIAEAEARRADAQSMKRQIGPIAATLGSNPRLGALLVRAINGGRTRESVPGEATQPRARKRGRKARAAV